MELVRETWGHPTIHVMIIKIVNISEDFSVLKIVQYLYDLCRTVRIGAHGGFLMLVMMCPLVI